MNEYPRPIRMTLKPRELAHLLGLKVDTIWKRIHRAGMYKSAEKERHMLYIPIDDPDIPEAARRAWLKQQESNTGTPESRISLDTLHRSVEKNNVLLGRLLKRLGTTE